MKPANGRGRFGLLAVVAMVALAHGLALDRLAAALSSGAEPAAAQPPEPSQVRLVQLVPPPPTAPVPAQARPSSPSPLPPAAAPSPRPAPPPRAAAAPAPVADPPSAADPQPPEPAIAPTPQDDDTLASSSRLQLQPDPTSTAGMPTHPTDTPPPVALPPDADLSYQVQGQARGLRYTASGELRWRQAGGQYELSMRLSAFLVGSRSQSSVGQVDATGLLPERFSDRTRSERAAHFDRSTGRIRFSNNAPDAPLSPGAQDRLSIFIQLAGLLQAGAFQTGDTIELPVAGVGGSQAWRFTVGDPETLVLPAGSIAARKLVREPADPYDSRVEVWLAPELGHLPVRLRITQTQGDVADQQLSRRP